MNEKTRSREENKPLKKAKTNGKASLKSKNYTSENKTDSLDTKKRTGAKSSLKSKTKSNVKNNGKNIVKNSDANKTVQKKANQNKTKNSKRTVSPKKSIKIIPLGGLGEIGKNITLYEYDGDMILVDCGMSFPDDDTPGIDIVIPDFSYVLENKDKIKGLLITHGHEDHIGSIPYLLQNFNVPLYGTALTLGIVEGKLKEHNLLSGAKLNVIKAGDKIELGKFSVEAIHVNHSIPDSLAFAINCRAGTVIQTGDFKIDTTPIDDNIIDIARFSEYGKKGVLALLSDSTNAERAGFTPSEKIVGESFSNLFAKAKNHRIIVATFSSNIHRIQQIISEADKCGRKVAVSGRSMVNVVNVASNLGYLHLPDNILVDIESIKQYPPEKLVIVTTGSQGEPLSALHRIAFNEHRQVNLIPGDMIIISATPIPGNEKTVGKVVNELMSKGANVVYEKMYDVHVSGHACAEELKIMMSLVKPKFFIPVHGEQKHLTKHAMLAESIGIKKENILIASNGDVIEISSRAIKCSGKVTAGRVLVDGLGVGDVGSTVLKDRIHLSDDGIIVVAAALDSVTGEIIAGPTVDSRGFVYVKESEELINELYEVACDVLEKHYISGSRDLNALKTKLRDTLSKFIASRTRRSPIVLPVVLEA